MWVVYDRNTGQSTEDMRFATEGEAHDWCRLHADPNDGDSFGIRYED